MKRVLVYMLAGMALVGTSCSDFLDTIPNDALSPSTTWQMQKNSWSAVMTVGQMKRVFCIGIAPLISALISISMKVSEMLVMAAWLQVTR